MSRSIVLACVLALGSVSANAQTAMSPAPEDIPKVNEYSPYVGHNSNFPRRVYWGDTHLHTSYSNDAGLIGNTLSPPDAYRFARGETVTSSTGIRARLVRPLDFLVAADHSENMGIAPMIADSSPELLSVPFGKKLYDMVQAGDAYEAFREWAGSVASGEDKFNKPEITRAVWDRLAKWADEFNDPGVFTAFIGYEWSSTTNASNLHRVVIFKDDSSKATRVVPFSSLDSDKPEDLWTYMEGYERETGGEVLAIPHNGNLSNGRMFAVEMSNGEPLTKEYAERRQRFEPIYEVTQIKGDGEAHPFLSSDDEFADYGTWDKGDILGNVPKTNEMLPHEYARSALKLGLEKENQFGRNPFKFGMIGSSDAHTSLATTREENYFGKFAGNEPSPERYKHYVIKALSGDDSLSTFSSEELASGLAAVWATENTREAIFNAMERKEVYATTGTRMIVRVFGGWDFKPEDVLRPDYAATGYARGVPMGGDLAPGPAGATPKFMIRAMRDPDGANIDRIQIVKGWLDSAGKLQEKVHDVALSEGRKVGSDGKAPPVGSTVDIDNATYTNDIGEPLFMVHWEDPDFDTTQSAFYYVRVIEIPTPSWLAHDRKNFGVDLPNDLPLTTQDRAYTSPIWYTPAS